MNEFELEQRVISLLLESDLFSVNSKAEQEFNFLQGEVYKCGTRDIIKNEDIVVEVLSIDDEQFQNAIVSVRTYVDDLNIGSPKLVPNIARLAEIADKFEKIFKTRGSSYGFTDSDLRMKLDTVKRERKQDFNQHCVNCLFKCIIRNC